MSKSDLKQWEHLTSGPWFSYFFQDGIDKDDYILLIPDGIDKDNFIVLAIDIYTYKVDYIYKYNINTNKWETSIKMDKHNIEPYYVSYPVLHKNNIYFTDGECLSILNVTTKTITKHPCNRKFIDWSSKLAILNDELFVIGGNIRDSISKWNAKTKQLAVISKMYTANLWKSASISDKKRNCITLFGGGIYGKPGYVDYILQFDAATNQFSKLPLRLPKGIADICTVTTNDNQCVLMFGGFYITNEYVVESDDIYIYSIKTQKVWQSSMKCPVKGQFSGSTCIGNNEKNEKDMLSVHGFMRESWTIMNVCFPINLLKIMDKYYMTEWVYLIEHRTGDEKNLYKITTLDIFNGTSFD
eukprot:266458_1